jgi:MFS family permease
MSLVAAGLTDDSAVDRLPAMVRNSAWHVLLATWFGMLFDGMDASIYVLTLYPSLSELMQTTDHALVAQVGSIVMAIFLCGWATGAVIFGLLADYFGRAKTLMITVLVYAVCTGLCATSHQWQELALYRFLVGVGIGGEISIGGVMLAECWTNKSRLHATGVLQSAFSFGVLLLAAINLSIGHFGWRYLYIVGVLPALLAIYIRLKLQEPASAQVARRHRDRLRNQTQQSLSREEAEFLRFPFVELFTAKYLRKTVIVAALASTVCMGHYAVVSWIPAWINQMTGGQAVSERSYAMLFQNFGAIVAALTGGYVVMRIGRAWAFRLAFMGAFVTCVAMFLLTKSYGPVFLIWTLITGFFVIAPYTYLFIYVPELFETRIRATAFGFSIQFGRVFAALAAIAGGQLIGMFGGSYALAGACISLLFLVGIVASFFLPLSKGEVSVERE